MRMIAIIILSSATILLTACETPAPVVYKTLPADTDGTGSGEHKHSSGGSHSGNADAAAHSQSIPPAVAANNAPNTPTDAHPSTKPQSGKPQHATAPTPPAVAADPGTPAAVTPRAATALPKHNANSDTASSQQQSADTSSHARSPAFDIQNSNANGNAAPPLPITNTVGNVTLPQQPTAATPSLTIPSGELASHSSPQTIHPALDDAQTPHEAAHSSSITLDRLAPSLASNPPSSSSLVLPVPDSAANPPANKATLTLPLPPDAKAGASGSALVFNPTDTSATLPQPQSRREALDLLSHTPATHVALWVPGNAEPIVLARDVALARIKAAADHRLLVIPLSGNTPAQWQPTLQQTTAALHATQWFTADAPVPPAAERTAAQREADRVARDNLSRAFYNALLGNTPTTQPAPPH